MKAIENRRTMAHGGFCGRDMARKIGDSVIGNMGEIAVSRHTGRVITSEFEDLGATDVAGGIEVRTTPHRYGHLLVYPETPDTSISVLCLIKDMRVQIAGWVYSSAAKSKEFWKEDAKPPCYWVPQDKLRHIDSLPPLTETQTEWEF